MPKCFLHAVRDYKNGAYNGGMGHDPFVMTTRSGLSIKKIPANMKIGTSGQPVIQSVKEDRSLVTKRRVIQPKHKPMSYMSFVTRFYLCIRAPELDLAGVSHRDMAQYWKSVAQNNGTSEFNTDNDDDDETDDDDDDDDDEDDEDEEDDTSVLDDFILRVAEDLNNNEATAATDITDQLLTSDSTKIRKTSEPLNELTNTTSTSNASVNDDSVVDEFPKYSVSQSPAHSVPDFDSQSTSDSIELTYNFERDCDDSQSSTSSDVFLDVDQKVSGILQHHSPIQINLANCGYVMCPHCRRLFSTLPAYTSHVKTHYKRKNACHLCGKEFSRSWLLKGHLRTHTGERPFACPFEGCEKAFADKSNLRAHLLIHTSKGKKHMCQKCGRAFTQKRYLHKHKLEVCKTIG